MPRLPSGRRGGPSRRPLEGGQWGTLRAYGRQPFPVTALGEGDLAAATALLTVAFPHDGVALVAAEKLLGDNGPRRGRTLGAWDQDRLVGVLAQAGRWLKLLAVAPELRRRGIGSALLEAARGDAGDRPLRYGDHPGNYLAPGLDQRDEAGRAFLLARGFSLVQTNYNLRTELAQNPLVDPARAQALADRCDGYIIRRAREEDREPLLAMVKEHFSPVWAFEVARALAHEPGGVHLALDPTGAPAAFAAHDGNNRGLGWFGPMGTLPSHRGRGLGEALLLPCLLDVGAAPEGGVIAWIGPAEFYRRTCGATVDRTFLVYEEGR